LGAMVKIYEGGRTFEYKSCVMMNDKCYWTLSYQLLTWIAGASKVNSASEMERYCIKYTDHCSIETTWSCVVTSLCQTSSASISGLTVTVYSSSYYHNNMSGWMPATISQLSLSGS